MKRFYLSLIVLLYLLTTPWAQAAASASEPVWYETDATQQAVINLYFFWSEKCPHCLEAKPDIVGIAKRYPWLRLHSLKLTGRPDNVRKFNDMASALGQKANSVPTFMFCGNMLSGYESSQTTGRKIESGLLACYQFAKQNHPDNTLVFDLDETEILSIDVPLLGTVSSNGYSLPAFTVFIAAMDAFNPCAFFVLLFLLSMLVYSQSRTRMLLVGGIFVFFSGAMYFLFMAAWLNLFLYLGELRLVTIIAGAIAVLIALINIKDYFWFKRGVSLSIRDNKKKQLFERIRSLLRLNSLPTVIVATVILALVANSYELLCTAGFPMIYNRILTLNGLSTESYYLYLLLYNLIYILPLLIIVVLFSIKLGARKLSMREGRILKLLSGVMMLLLGSVLIVAPQLLNDLATAAMLLLFAIAISWLIVRLGGTNPDSS